MRRKSIFLCHVLIIGVIGTNSDSSSVLNGGKPEENASSGAGGSSCPHLEETRTATARDDARIPDCEGSHIGEVCNKTGDGHESCSLFKSEGRKNGSLFVEKLTRNEEMGELNDETDGNVSTTKERSSDGRLSVNVARLTTNQTGNYRYLQLTLILVL